MPAIILHKEYSRKEVHDIFSPDTRFTQSSGSWGLHGIIKIQNQPGDFVFFVSFGQHQAGHTFDEWITEEGIISWQSQPRQSFEDRRIQQFLHHDEWKNAIHLFLRTRRSINYTYLGKLKYVTHNPTREKPVYIYWQLMDWPIPGDVLSRINLRLQPADMYRRGISQIMEPVAAHDYQSTSFIWHGKTWNVNRLSLISQVRDWIKRGLPQEATRHKDWYIDVDGQRISPKWLFHLITGAGYNEFDAPQARGKLAQIGLYSIRMTKEDRVVITQKVKRDKPNKDIQTYVPLLENRIEAIQKILVGLDPTPSDDVLCDWVHFCYDFGLFSEGQLLFSLVTAEQVNPWYYERTKKLARLCSMRSVAKD